MWGDLREIEKRRQKRKIAKMPPEKRRQQLAEEWTECKKAATAAKATSDKSARKALGLRMRDLKLEMQQVGKHASEAPLFQPVPL